MPLAFPVPPLSTASAHLLSSLFACVFVGSIYLSKNSRLSFSGRTVHIPNGYSRLKERDERWRDDPDVIRARLAATTFATFLCCLGVFGIVGLFVGDLENGNWITLESTITRLGLTLDGLSLWPHLITPILFLGPLYARYLSQTLPFQTRWSFQTDVAPLFFSWQGVRNYVFAPITEELVFRACVLSVYQLSGASMTSMIFLSPMSFGAAHVHHAWDKFNRYGRTVTAAKHAILATTIQFIYTTVFGFYCCYLFIRTGSVFPPITAHSFCNVMGLPQLNTELQRWPQKRFAIIATYLIGIAGFIYTLSPWTYSGESLYWMRLTLEKDRIVNTQGRTLPFY